MMELMDPRRMCPHCRAFITTKDRICPYCNEAVAPRQVSRDDSNALVGGFISHLHFNTTIILLMNIGLYIVTAVFSLRSGNSDAFFNLDGRTLIAFGGKFDPLLAQGEWWRLVTAGFLHGGMLHIFMNTWALFGLGAQVEETFGSSRMWVIYFVSTVRVLCERGMEPRPLGGSVGRDLRPARRHDRFRSAPSRIYGRCLPQPVYVLGRD